MPGDPYYRSKAWLRLRSIVLRRAKDICETPGCGGKGIIVDHVKSRRAGGTDELSNLRLLCRRCDNRVKEGRDGQRKSGGKLIVGCYPDGSPRDPNHSWFKAQS